MAKVHPKRRKPLARTARFPLRPWQVKLRKAAAPQLRKQARRLVDALDSAGVLRWFAEYVRVRYYDNAVHSIANELDRAADKKALLSKSTSVYERHPLVLDVADELGGLFKAGSKFGFAKLGFDVAWNIDSPEAKQALAKRSNLIGGIGESQFGNVLDTVRQAIYDLGGHPVTGETVAAIKAICNKQADWQAERIARTEALAVSSTAQHIALKENGAERKQWVWSGVSREEHAAIDGETVDFDDTFSNGLMYPGDESGDASETINCSCSLVPVLSQALLDDLAAEGVEVG